MATPTYVIATDLSSHSRRAAAVAARLAARTRATLDFFCAVPASVVDEDGIDLGRARAAVAALARTCANDAGRKTAAHVAVVRDVPAAILRHVRRSGATLLVVAPHGVTGWKRVMLGSVTEKVLRHSTGSVLVARGDGRAPFKRILVGAGPGPGGAAPMRHAIALARALGAELSVVHVVPTAELLLPLVTPVGRALRVSDERLAAKTREVERWAASFPARGVRLSVRVIEGSPPETLVGEARRRRADLVVVGAADDARLRRALLGSVSHAVAATSSASVLVVRRSKKKEQKP